MTSPEAFSQTHYEILGLQSSLEDRLRKLPVPFSSLCETDQAMFYEKESAYANFELTQLDEAWVGMPLIAEGEGYYVTFDLKADKNSDPSDLHKLKKGQSLSCIIDTAGVLPIPPLENSLALQRSTPGELRVSVLLGISAVRLDTGQYPPKTFNDHLVFLSLAYPGLIYDRPDVAYIEVE